MWVPILLRNIGGLWYEFLSELWTVECFFHKWPRGFVFCALWPMKLFYSNGSVLNTWGRNLSPGLWTTRELLTPWNINWQKLSKRPPSQHQDQALPKSQQALGLDTPCQSFSKWGTQSCTLAGRLPKATWNLSIAQTTLLYMALPFRERRFSSTYQNTGTSSPTRKSSQGNGPNPSTGGVEITIKRN